jgi:cystathionine gamma-synthase
VDPWTAVDRSTIWPYQDGRPREHSYIRDGHPTGEAAEAALGKLDGGHALLFASGLAAAAAALLGLLRQGQSVAIAADAYYGVGVLIRDLERWGLSSAEFDQTTAPPAGVDLVWLEAPSNPFLTFPDLGAAAAGSAPVIVDSTAATPIHLRALEHGADFVLHSATKFLGGHHDLLLGVLVCRREEDHERLLEFRTRTGAIATPDAAALLLRSLETLRVRVERQSATALELARRLAEHPAVELVRYPGLEPDPLAARYMEGGFGALLSFDVRRDAQAVEKSVSLIANATSLGGVRSTIESRRRWEGERVPEGLLRLSVGLEDVDELWTDLEQALAAA